jgi:hypothetical protein
MADPTSVNPQITDSVTQPNTALLRDAPAQGIGTLYQTLAHSVGLVMQNAVAAQRNMATIDAAVTTQGIALLYSLPDGANEIFSGNALAETLAQPKATVEKLGGKPA